MCTLDEGPGSFCGRAEDFGEGPPCAPGGAADGALPSDSAARSNLSFVGPGRGHYIQETTYKYVGDGTGEFDIVGSSQQQQQQQQNCDLWRYCCCLHPSFPLCFFPFLLTAGLLSIILWLLLRPPQPAGFNCQAGREWMDRWPSDKQDWCCQHAGACLGGQAARAGSLRTVSSGLSSCQEGLATWKTSWSEEKKRYCCESFRLGCVGSPSYNCSDGLSRWRSSWSSRKKGYCCQSMGRGCSRGAEAALFDCQVGRVNWWVSWTTEKKTWCCSNEAIACSSPPIAQLGRLEPGQHGAAAPLPGTGVAAPLPPAAAPAAANPAGASACDAVCVYKDVAASCSVRVQFAAKHKFEGRKGACAKAVSDVVADCSVCSTCSASDAGCQDEEQQAGSSPATPAPFDCTSGIGSLRLAWSVAKQTWCCAHAQLGCQDDKSTAKTAATAAASKAPAGSGLAAVSDEHYCTAGFSTWREGWSQAKKAWCCEHASRGCPESTSSTTSGSPDGSPRYDCDAGYANWVQDWPDGKKAWCCEHGGRGCPTASECQATGIRDLPLDRRKWCCENEHVGCDAAGASNSTARSRGGGELPGGSVGGSVPFDCLASIRNWEKAWSEHKKAWCCRHRGRGCPDTALEPYDCDNGLRDWEQAWDVGKKAWCCQHHRKGCPRSSTSVPYDCLDGFDNWANLWSEPKQSWCCKNRNRGCPTV